MNHKITLWPSIAAVLIWLTPLFLSHCGEKVEPPKPILQFRLLDPGIPGLPNLPPAPKIDLESGPIVLG